jgi:hypothetical protein
VHAHAFIAHEDVAQAEDESLNGLCGNFQINSLRG